MSLSTATERNSAIHVGLPWRGMFPFADSLLNANDRAQVAGFVGIHFSPVITSTAVLQNPVDYQLAGEPAFRERYRTYEISPRRVTEQGRGRTAGVRRLSGSAPSFTTTTTKRGYD
jgi:hypothetical protein